MFSNESGWLRQNHHHPTDMQLKNLECIIPPSITTSGCRSKSLAKKRKTKTQKKKTHSRRSAQSKKRTLRSTKSKEKRVSKKKQGTNRSQTPLANARRTRQSRK